MIHALKKAVLFDLDGTLVDTAPDMAWALNQVCLQENQELLNPELIRCLVSEGSVALLKSAFPKASDEKHHDIKQRFLNIYANNICQYGGLFEGIEHLLQQLDQAKVTWGIVTNKPEQFTVALLKTLNLDQRAACIVSGDSTPYQKPHPYPIEYACQLLNCEPQHCIYIGDAERDIIAGKAAGLKTIIALYGYLAKEEQPLSWKADANAHSVDAIREQLFLWLQI